MTNNIDIENPDIIRIFRLTSQRADVQLKRNRIRHRLNYWENIVYSRRELKKKLEDNWNGCTYRQRLICYDSIPKKHLKTEMCILKKKVLDLKLAFARVQLEIHILTSETSKEFRNLLLKNKLTIHRKPGGALISHLSSRSNILHGIRLNVEMINNILLNQDIEDILLKAKV